MDLIKLNISENLPANIETIEESHSFFPRVQLMTPLSKAFQDSLIGQGVWGLFRSSTSVTDLGKEFDALVIAMRAKAMRFKDMVTNYDQNSETFKQIMDAAATPNSGNVYGPDYLLYVAGEGFATYFCSNKSARAESPAIRGNMHKAVTFSISAKQGQTSKYFVPVVKPCVSFAEIPSDEELQDNYDKYMALSNSEVEVVDDKADDR